jgi:DNA-binding NarL/FixJ family response regulator
MTLGIVVLTMHKEEGVFNKALDLGVLGYVLKESAIQEVIDGIRAAANGEHFISPTISRYLVNRRTRSEQVLEEYPGLASLTESERRILKMIAEQKTSRDIAERLFLSVLLRTIG